MPSIPASAIVNIVPNVVDAGGTGLDFSGLILTSSTRVPIGTPLRFASASAVSSYFGALTTEALLASIYFAGYDGSQIKPAQLLFSQYPVAPVVAYLRGGPLGMTLTQVQGIAPGTLTLQIDGRSVTSSTINLSAASSLSNAASLIQTGLNDKDASTTGSISGTALTVSSGAGIAIGQTVSGTGVSAGTVVVSGSGTSWVVSPSQTVASGTLVFGQTTVTYDSLADAFVVTAGTPGAAGAIAAPTGALATALKLTAATAAVTSQGAIAGVPATAMEAITAQTQDFVSFMTAFKPSTADMVAFSAWNNGKGNRYLYVGWDNDGAATTGTDTTSFGHQINALNYSGTAPIYDPGDGASKAASMMGDIASIDFNRTNGRVTLAFRSGPVTPGVTNETIAANLILNGYNFYGSYATANAEFQWFYPGQVSGPFSWIDSYINQIQINNSLQLALMTLLKNVGRIPYNPDGYAMIEASMKGVVDDGLNFGSITPQIALSDNQVIEVNALAGKNIAPTLSTRGWYIVVQDPGAMVRAARGTPIVILFYCDGQAVQRIVVGSNEIE